VGTEQPILCASAYAFLITMNQVTLTIDGKDVALGPGTVLLEAARKAGIEIPTLCYNKNLLTYGACRLCIVEIVQGGKSRLVASCAYPAEEGLKVLTKSPRVVRIRKLMIELLLSLAPYMSRVRELADEYGVKKSRFKPRLSMCILCGLCVRHCAEVKKTNAVGFIGRGTERRLAWTPDSAYKDKCAKCFQCFYICPTGVFPSNWSMGAIKQLKEL
jgi:bidirectional [NiFe] hydrogenase diaphorase subunit